MSDFRVYSADELLEDGYPAAWHVTIKHAVREAAGHRCVRCGHPFRVGKTPGEWSPCDERCAHGEPVRWCYPGDEDEWFEGLGCEDTAGNLARYGPDFQDAYGPVSVEAHWRVLTVHHLDGNKANCRWWNLAALCQRCHLEIQGKVRLDRPWPWPHSAWMCPYAAGFYALKYLAEDLTREQTMARLEELLELGLAEEAVERLPV